MYSIFTDTSAWYAYMDKDDAGHDSAVNVIRNLSRPLITSNYIFDEIMTLAKLRLGFDVAATFGKKLWNQDKQDSHACSRWSLEAQSAQRKTGFLLEEKNRIFYSVVFADPRERSERAVNQFVFRATCNGVT